MSIRVGEGVKLAAPGIDAVNIDPKLVEFYAEHLHQRLGYAGVKVISPKEIGALIGLERQRQLLGCNEGTSCLAELAGALGVDGVLMGSLAKVGDTFQLNLKVVSSGDASVLATYAVRTDDEETLLKQLSFAAKDMARDLYAKLNRGTAPDPVAAEVEARTGKVRRFSWVPLALGGALAVTGTVLIILANQESAVLHPAPGTTVSEETATQAARQGQTYQTLWIASFSVAAACVLTGMGMLIFGGPTGGFQTAFVPNAGGGTFALGGVF